jgi:Nif-specific regulatory protein
MSQYPAPSDQSEKHLRLLHQVAGAMGQSQSLGDELSQVLRLIVEGSDLRRATLTLLDGSTRELFIEEAMGLSPAERGRGRYKLGEGITGRVVETGQALVVPDIADSPHFLNRTGARGHDGPRTSFVCVPLMIGKEVVGAISADRPFEPHHDLSNDVRLLEIVGSLISQGVALRRETAAVSRALAERNQEPLHEPVTSRVGSLVGRSKPMQRLYELVGQVARANTTVLITGESGTGKELVASAIHDGSERAGRAFIRVNCGALPEGVIDSELFGHEKGAFTGATHQRKGRFEMADGGTLFLDEVGELTPAAQVKLLRVLQERELERVGGNKTVRVDVRLIAATSRNLEELIQSGRFRPDLFYRLNVFPIHMPALRERSTDITLLADHFVDKYNRVHGRTVRRIATSAIDMLMSYHWPGNVRELENCIERSVLLSNDDVIHGHNLPPTLQTDVASGTEFKGKLQDEVDTYERTLLLDALKSTNGNMAAAARILGISERVVGLRIRRFNIDPRRFKQSVRARH